VEKEKCQPNLAVSSCDSVSRGGVIKLIDNIYEKLIYLAFWIRLFVDNIYVFDDYLLILAFSKNLARMEVM
jgi:hypothetical protein